MGPEHKRDQTRALPSRLIESGPSWPSLGIFPFARNTGVRQWVYLIPLEFLSFQTISRNLLELHLLLRVIYIYIHIHIIKYMGFGHSFFSSFELFEICHMEIR